MNPIQMMLAAVGGVAPDPALGLKLSDYFIFDEEVTGSAAAAIEFQSNGTLTFTGNDTPAEPSDEWFNPHAGFSDGNLYEVAFTVLVSGSSPDSGAALGVYATLTSERAWAITQGGSGTNNGVWTFRIREIADPTGNFVDATMTMKADVD